MKFLGNIELRPIGLSGMEGCRSVGLALGKGPNALEVAVAEASFAPSASMLRTVWKNRLAGRATPLMLVVLNDGKAAICGPAGDPPPTYSGLDPDKVERLCAAALEEPSRNAALRLLYSAIPQVDAPLFGLRNEGLFANHQLRTGVPGRDDWKPASDKARGLLDLRGKELIQKLGFSLEQLPGADAYVLRAAETRLAVAVLLDRGESPDAPSPHFAGLSAASYALAKADAENVDYVLISSGPSLRLYPVKTGIGVGRRGRTETFIQANLDLLPENQSGYLWLLFASDALASGGSVEQILHESTRYAAVLGAGLRERIYDEVIPKLAEAMLEARKLKSASAQDLQETYEMAMLVLFRLLFIAYAEDKDLLPVESNALYEPRSLTRKTKELIEIRNAGTPFGKEPTHWEEAVRLWRAVDKGSDEWALPAYNGGLFSSDEAASPLGAKLERIRLPDFVFGPILTSLLVSPTDEGWGPIDFRSLGVREFGTIYEGLLESELSLAETDLSLEDKGKNARGYRPAKPKDEIAVPKGRAYLHDTSGTRKATGSYFTKHFAVEHLLDHGLEPALQDHLTRLDALNDGRAADAFFDFRVADIAMGSGHFLVAAVDRIERGLSNYLVKRALPDVINELERLKAAARKALGGLSDGFEIENNALLRRQIARRCIFGVDMNPTAVELARLSIWIHTFVPGLPLSFLDHNLVAGNSLVGIATFDEAAELSKEILNSSLFAKGVEEMLGKARKSLDRLAKLSDANAAEIQTAREAWNEARTSLSEEGALLDTLTAARIDDDVRGEIAKRWIKKPASIVESKEHQFARKALESIPPFHFPIAFPEVFLRERPGFDAIIGNPPWEEATVEEDRFWTRYEPGFHSLQQREQENTKKRLRRERGDLVGLYEAEVAQAELLRRMLTSGSFPGMGTGDPDVYKAFCWRFWNLVRGNGGSIGVVLPRSAFAAKGSEHFRRAILAEATFADLTFLLNRDGWAFDDAEPRYTIALSSFRKRKRSDDAQIPWRGPFASLASYQVGVTKEPVRFKVQELITWTDSAAFPLLPSEESGEVFLQLRKGPRLDFNDLHSWRARPHTELHATNDKPLMRLTDDPPDGYWPVFKGESFDIWTADTGKYYAWADPEKVKKALHEKRLRSYKQARSPFSELPADWNRNPATLPCLHPRVTFRDVSRATDTRTVRAALLPPKIFITNKAPYFLWPRGDERDQAYPLGVLCSIPLDWYARRFVELDLNYHVLNPFPIPRPDRDNKLWLRTVEIAGRLACPDARFKAWAGAVGVKCGKLNDEEKQDLIHELDAVVAHLYGLSEKQLSHIFETFHEGWDYQARLKGTLEHFGAFHKLG